MSYFDLFLYAEEPNQEALATFVDSSEDYLANLEENPDIGSLAQFTNALGPALANSDNAVAIPD